jgi:hypothetical protein
LIRNVFIIAEVAVQKRFFLSTGWNLYPKSSTLQTRFGLHASQKELAKPYSQIPNIFF